MNKAILSIITFALCTGCEQSVRDDITFLHPFPGEEPAAVAVYSQANDACYVEARYTQPVFSPAPQEFLNDATAILRSNSERYPLVHRDSGAYYVEGVTIPAGDSCALSLEILAGEVMLSNSVVVPVPHRITGWDSIRKGDEFTLTGTYFHADPEAGVSTELIRYGEGKRLGRFRKFPKLNGVSQPVVSGENPIGPFTVRPSFTIFGGAGFIPTDTVNIDSVQVLVHTWSPETVLFNEAQEQTGREFGDGDETIEDVSYTNFSLGHGVFTAYSSDTLTIVLRP